MSNPIRTCVCCRQKAEKDELIRFVWSGTEPVRDETGRVAGRGAYCCRDGNCLELFTRQQKKWKRVFKL